MCGWWPVPGPVTGRRVKEMEGPMRRMRESQTATYAAQTEQSPVQGQWTYDDYARLPDDGMRYEVVRGELFISPAPRPLHQRVILRLSYLLNAFLVQHNSGEVLTAPIDVLLPKRLGDPVQPDIVVVASERQQIVGDLNIQGAPDLVIEVLSPTNAEHDRTLKYEIYAEAGVTEYWIVDPHERTVEVFVLRDGGYEPRGRYGEGETARSEILDGFTAAIDEIIPA